MQQFEGGEKQNQMLREGDPDFQAKILAKMHERFASWLAPQLAIALEDCTRAPEIIAMALGVAIQMEMLGTSHEAGVNGKETKEFQAELDQINDTIAKVRAKCMKSYKVDGVYWGAYHLTGTICGFDQPFTLNAKANLGGASATGAFVFTPSGDSGGAWAYEGSMQGLRYHGSSTYQLAGLDADAPAIEMITGHNWSIELPPPVSRTMPLGEGHHLGDGGLQRITLERDPTACPQP